MSELEWQFDQSFEIYDLFHINNDISDIFYINIQINEQGNKLSSLSKKIKFLIFFPPEKET